MTLSPPRKAPPALLTPCPPHTVHSWLIHLVENQAPPTPTVPSLLASDFLPDYVFLLSIFRKPTVNLRLSLTFFNPFFSSTSRSYTLIHPLLLKKKKKKCISGWLGVTFALYWAPMTFLSTEPFSRLEVVFRRRAAGHSVKPPPLMFRRQPTISQRIHYLLR